MGIKAIYTDLKGARDEAQALMKTQGEKPKVLSATNLGTFFDELGHAFDLIAKEKEILFFAVLQWVAIGIGYVLWTQILDWIPDSVWDAVAKASEDDRDSGFGLINLVLLAWSFVVVMLVSYPLAILNAAIIAVHYLNSTGQESTVPKALAMAQRHTGRQWVFTTIDAWITVEAILDRLPKKRGRRTALEEALYYAWKIGTFGVLPALVAGKGFKDAGVASFQMLKARPGRVIGVRMGYSLIAWIVGILAYAGAIAWFCMHTGDSTGTEKANWIFDFYSLMAVPLVLAVGFLAVFVRPFFMVMLARLYTAQFPYEEPKATGTKHEGTNVVTVFFVSFLLAFLAIYFFGDDLGFSAWIEKLAAQDFARGAG